MVIFSVKSKEKSKKKGFEKMKFQLKILKRENCTQIKNMRP